MRREVDATELDDVYVEETEDEFGEPVATADTKVPSAAPTAVSAATTTPGAPTPAGETHDAGGARAYTVEGGSGTNAAIANPTDTGNTNQAPGGGTANP
jgi:hypothetical protein